MPYFNDTLMVFREPNLGNFVIMMVLEPVNFEKVKKEIWYDKGVKLFPKLRSHIATNLGFCYWVEKNPDDAIERVQKTSRHLKNEDEIKDYCEDLIAVEYPHDTFQWELHVQENYGEGKSLMIMKGNHALTDGGGLISLCLA